MVRKADEVRLAVWTPVPPSLCLTEAGRGPVLAGKSRL
jgi:hypothetical protein